MMFLRRFYQYVFVIHNIIYQPIAHPVRPAYHETLMELIWVFTGVITVVMPVW